MRSVLSEAQPAAGDPHAIPVPLTRRFAELLHAWQADDVALIERCRWLLADGLACAVGGAGETGPATMAGLVAARGSAPNATVIGTRLRTSDVAAARLNGMSMHVLDFEPMWKPANHAISTTLPAILAVAETLEAAGAQPQGLRLLRALAKGVETQGRLRYASGQYELAKLKFHPPGVVGPISSAVAAGDLLDLDVDHLVAAIGIAASRAGSVLANVGSMTKALHCGDATAHGLEAALLAARGFTADPDALDGPRGFCSAYFGDTFQASRLVEPLVAPRALDPGPAWKLFPTQYGTHYAITAGLDCHQAMGGRRDIAKVEATVPFMPYVDRPRPKSGLDGKFSFQYAIAAALLDGEVTVATYADERRFAPDMVALLERITLVPDETIPCTVDAMWVELKVTASDGTVTVKRCDAPIGSWGRPVGRDRLDAKVRGLLDGAVGAGKTDRLFELVHGGGEFSVTELLEQVVP
jgi:2-methylcitrate dehydratase PrpD